MQHVASIAELLPHYDGFIVDLWGVIHDGTALYDGVIETLAAVQAQGKALVLLSNAPRRAATSRRGLAQFGIGPDHYNGLVTSGEATYMQLQAHYRDKRCYYLGAGDERDFLDGLSLRMAERADHADFVLNTGHRYPMQPLSELKEELEILAWLDLPMLCANPDIEVIKIDGTRYPCAGELAAYYQTLGGRVQFIGKPYPLVYVQAKAVLADAIADANAQPRLLAVGDNLDTDIAGAANQSLDSLLITGGMLRERLHRGGRSDAALVTVMAGEREARPTYYTESFGLI